MPDYEIPVKADSKATDINLPASRFDKFGNFKKSNGDLNYMDKMGIIRLIAMFSIVWSHSLLGWETLHVNNPNYQFIQSIIVELGKMGTVCFFIITGYFLNGKIQNYTVIGYIKHRFFSLIFPWIFFLLLLVLIKLFEVVPLSQLIHWKIGHTIHYALHLAHLFIVYSTYWFVPMLVISICALIIFNNYLNKIWFGIFWIAITLFFCTNLYVGWVPQMHTQSFFGYTFFIWLGYQVKRFETEIQYYLSKISWYIIIPAAIVIFFIASFEGMILLQQKSGDPFASIRISNILMSLMLFISMLKTKKFNWINKFNPRKYVFGIYLVHCIIIFQFKIILDHIIKKQIDFNHLDISLLLQFVFFILSFFTSLLVVFLITKSKLKFLLGQ